MTIIDLKKIFPMKIKEMNSMHKERKLYNFDSSDIKSLRNKTPEPIYRNLNIDYTEGGEDL